MCDATQATVEEMRRHVESHMDAWFVQPTWAELVEALPHLHLPREIYVCGIACPERPHLENRCYVRADDVSENPTSAMLSSQDACPHCIRHDGSVNHALHVVHDADTARKIVQDKSVPDARKCTLCPPRTRPLIDPNRATLLNHLRSHEGEMWSCEEEWD